MNEDNNIRRKSYQQDKAADSAALSAGGDISHLFQYFTQTDPKVLTDPEYLLEQFGITAEELGWILERQ